MKPIQKATGERLKLKTVQAALGEDTSDWYDATTVDPQLPGYYNVEATNLAATVARLFWTGWRWLYEEGGKTAIDLRAARKARWQGAAKPTGATFVPEKRKKNRFSSKLTAPA
jgi:hypothetical protein